MELPSTATFRALHKTASAIKDLYVKVQQSRINSFLEYVDLRWESMTEEDRIKFNEFLKTEYGQEQLVDFVDSILKTSCKRARMAIALLYCKDNDFDFDPATVNMTVIAMHGMTDDLLDFFLQASKVPSEQHVLYPVATITCDTTGPILQKWDHEAISININDLITRRIFLPDPKVSTGVVYGDGNPNNWSIPYGITKRSRDIARLVEKASLILGDSIRRG